jgi:hypothetical protein
MRKQKTDPVTFCLKAISTTRPDSAPVRGGNQLEYHGYQ